MDTLSTHAGVQVKGHAAGVVALGFSPDGRKLLSIGAEGLI